jgi:CRP/FNR family cyclic AMP-dependent transcriptional regulator
VNEAHQFLLAHGELVALGLISARLLIPRSRFVRLCVLLYAGLQLYLAITTRRDETVLIWSAVLLGLATLFLAVDLLGGRRARLSREEQAMVGTLLHRVPRGRAKHFIEQGFWLTGRRGDVLVREGEPVRHLYFLSEGEAGVIMADRQVGSFVAGEVIGDLTMLTAESAAATVALSGPARFWCAPAERIEPYLNVHAELRRQIEKSIAKARTVPAEAAPPIDPPPPVAGQTVAT